MSCFKADVAMPPRHSVAVSGLTKNPMERSRTPYFSTGSISCLPSFSTPYGRTSSTPNILGILGPKMSVSSNPTLYPKRAKAIARLAETVLFPTPPLPELTAMIFFTCGNNLPTSGRGALLNSVSMVTSTSFPTE